VKAWEYIWNLENLSNNDHWKVNFVMLDIMIFYTHRIGKCLILNEAYTREHVEKLPITILDLKFFSPSEMNFFCDMIKKFIKYPRHGMKFLIRGSK